MTDQRRVSTIPPPPPGFVIEGAGEGAIPPPPPGFVLDAAPPAHESDALRRSRSFAQGFADLTTFGLADEAAAAVGTLGGMLPGGHGKGYSQLLEEIRGQSAADAEAHPYANLSGKVTGGVGGAVGLAKGGLSLAANAAQAGKGWFARMLGGAADGGIAAGLYGAGSGEGGRDRLVNAATSVPYGLAVGAAGEGLASGLGAIGRRVFQGVTRAAPGISAAANVSDAAGFGIPLSRAQATRSVPQANIENQLRSQGAMTGFDDAQRQAVRTSVGSVQSKLAGSTPVIASQASAYDNVPAALRQTRDTLKAASQQAYDASVNNPNVLVSGQAVRNIPDFIRNRLTSDQILIDPMYHQGAARAMSFIDDYISRMPVPGGNIKGVQAQLRWVENLRAGLRKNFPPLGQDAPALKAISSAIDDWTDEIFDKGLVNASDDVLDELKAARAKWSEYKAMSDPRAKIGGKLNPQYEAQARIRSIMDKDMSPEEIGRYLWGSSVATPKNASFMTAQLLRKTLGADSPEWSAIRQSFWLRATRASDEVLSPVQIAKNLEGLLDGNGKAVAQSLYTQIELDLMRKYAGVMRNLSPAREGLNFSNTANRLMPSLPRYGMAIMGALAGGGSIAGGLGPLEALGVGALTSGVLKGGGAIANASRASAATRMPSPINPSGAGGAVVRGGSIPLVIGQEPRRPLEITAGRMAR
ncbi:hypothetical protein ACSBOB_00920 [Mesorhizobium sp. ASY16-5R]|uniref:hypothetical protein n=1 Tax=Mesorhizobium sp. ASY16-5R TaxID=3445772 RepID=UPI003FA0EBCB